jgi:hypothetical protein
LREEVDGAAKAENHAAGFELEPELHVFRILDPCTKIYCIHDTILIINPVPPQVGKGGG